jgi:hypothetical protein
MLCEASLQNLGGSTQVTTCTWNNALERLLRSSSTSKAENLLYDHCSVSLEPNNNNIEILYVLCWHGWLLLYCLRWCCLFQYAFAYFCLKLVNYSFFFWLPYYLHASFGWLESVADKISIWYDIGGIVGKTNGNF